MFVPLKAIEPVSSLLLSKKTQKRRNQSTMKTMKHAVFLLVVFLLLVTTKVSSDGEEASREVADLGAPALPPPHIIVDAKDCVGACDERCSLHSRKNVCSRACLTCCNTCRCVPAGTAGNTETCGKCYTEWKTHGNRTKCP